MPQRTFYLTDDVYSKLRDEKNASALISKLITAHFEDQEAPPNLTAEELKEAEKVNEVWIAAGKRLTELGVIDPYKPMLVKK